MLIPSRVVKAETVSSRLRQTLIHPDKSGVLLGVAYTSDSRYLVAGHHKSGVIQVWDAVSGRQLSRIEAGGRPGLYFDYFCLSPDGTRLYVYRGSQSTGSVKKDGKRLIRLDFAGDVRVWDVVTGELKRTYAHSAPRGIWGMELSPDGSTLVTHEGLSGVYESLPKEVTSLSLWDARSGGRIATVSEVGLPAIAFTRDSKTLLVNEVNQKGESTATLLLDAATGKIRRSLRFPAEQIRRHHLVMSPDGKTLAGEAIKADSRQCALKLWDATSGQEIASFAVEKQNHLRKPLFSPDGKRLAVATQSFANTTPAKHLLLVDGTTRHLVKQLALGDKATVRQPVFSPDGKWIAVITQEADEWERDDTSGNIALLPQPRIQLIEAATGEIKETLIAPPGIAVSLCFSPDGKTLASGGDGRVLLWDMTKPPGSPR